MTAAEQSTLHVGRSWSGHGLEDGCPCPKAACGLVVGATVDAACPQHALATGKTIRQTHAAEQCPARMTISDQTPATKRCGECRLGLGVHTTTDPYCDHHQTPATHTSAAAVSNDTPGAQVGGSSERVGAVPAPSTKPATTQPEGTTHA